MGGIGSGRRQQSGKRTTDDCRALDVRHIQRDGLLAVGSSFISNWMRNGKTVASISVRTETDRVILDYRHQRSGGEWQQQNYPVRLEWTPCNYGGRRAWFLCPANDCGRRVAKLYLGGAGIFACRHCYHLAYASQREAAPDLAARRADTLRARLGWPAGILNGNGGKPKGMRWRTFERLTRLHDEVVGVSLAGMMNRVRQMKRRLGGTNGGG